MDDARYEELCDSLNALADKWVPVFGLYGWRIGMDFNREGGTHNGLTDGETSATTETKWQYMQAHISWDMPMIEDADEDGRLERHALLGQKRLGLRRQGLEGRR